MTVEAFLIIAAWAFCAGYTIASSERRVIKGKPPESIEFAICVLFGPLLCPANLGAEAFRRLYPKGEEK
jgi:hypothetical protein